MQNTANNPQVAATSANPPYSSQAPAATVQSFNQSQALGNPPYSYPYSFAGNPPGAASLAPPPPQYENPLAPPPLQQQAGITPQKPNILNLTLLTGNCPVQINLVSNQMPDGAIEKFHKNS